MVVLRRFARRMRCFLWRRQDGSAVTEFALIVPAFFLVVFAILAFGRAYQRLNVLTAALREGARYGSTLGDPCASAADVKQRVVNYATPFGVAIDPTLVVVSGDPSCDLLLLQGVTVGVSAYPLFSDLMLYGLDSQTVTRSATFRWELAP